MKTIRSRSRGALSALALLTLLGAGVASSHARDGGPARPLAHCKWGDFGCSNPPPAFQPGAVRAQRAASPDRAHVACDPVLSSPGECWTDCKTEDDITICDIVSTPRRPGR